MSQIHDPVQSPDETERGQFRARTSWELVRSYGKKARRAFTDCLQAHGVSGAEFGACTNSTYRGVTGRSAQELRRDMGLSARGSIRDHMTVAELSYVMASESLGAERIESVGAQGVAACCWEAFTAGQSIRRAIESDRANRAPYRAPANQNEAPSSDAA